jgi:hypothetical protein
MPRESQELPVPGFDARRKRSPLYPGHSLSVSLDRAAQLHAACKEHAGSLDDAAAAWGVSATSSGLLQIISSLKQFGLVEDEGSRGNRLVRLTDLALDILLDDPGSPERRQKLQRAALTPRIYQELWNRFGQSLPPQDGVIRMYLVRQREDGTYNPDSVDRLIADMRSSLAFAGLDNASTIMSDDEPATKQHRSLVNMNANNSPAPVTVVNWQSPQTPSQMPANTAAGRQGQESLRIPITLPSLKVAWLEVPQQLTASEYKTLVDSIAMFRDALVVSHHATHVSTVEMMPALDDDTSDAVPRLPR